MGGASSKVPQANEQSKADKHKIDQQYEEVAKYLDDPEETLELLNFLYSIYGKNANNKCTHNVIVDSTYCVLCRQHNFDFLIEISPKYKYLAHRGLVVSTKYLFGIGPKLHVFDDSMRLHLKRRRQIISKLEKFVESYEASGSHDMDELIESTKRYLKECEILMPPTNRIDKVRDIINRMEKSEEKSTSAPDAPDMEDNAVEGAN